MKDMDGFGTLRQMRDTQMGADVPVIFLTADTDPEKEAECFKIGGMDFIRKPVVSEVLIQRVKHTIELIQLQRNLAATVERKSQENEKLSLHVVQTLARTIDAKDPYTNGHSTRVAAYAKEIARRCGYTEREQSEIFMMGLLHDVGKIGVPDSIINKKGKLTEEEYTVIQSHPKVGANILEYIEEMPRLSEGARWHHEWYNGSGYPDHLSGDEIPEQARIIAVADAYDAMSSRRIYRDIMNQEDIRREIRNGRGTQFDPVFVDVMLQMIEEDKEFKMREIK